MLCKLFLCILMLVLFNGCATYRNDNLERMSSLPQQYSQFDAKLAWEITSTGTSTSIDGVIQNIRYYEMDGIEIWVSALDPAGKEIYRAADFVYTLKENEVAQFSLKIPRTASGTKLQFTYSYSGHDGGGDSGDAVAWRQSFGSEVP